MSEPAPSAPDPSFGQRLLRRFTTSKLDRYRDEVKGTPKDGRKFDPSWHVDLGGLELQRRSGFASAARAGRGHEGERGDSVGECPRVLHSQVSRGWWCIPPGVALLWSRPEPRLAQTGRAVPDVGSAARPSRTWGADQAPPTGVGMDDQFHRQPDPRERLRSGVAGIAPGSRTVRARSAVEVLAAAGVTDPTTAQIIEAANRI